jgi:hypothetical protein
VSVVGFDLPFAQAIFFLGEDDDRASFRSLISERGELRGIG